VSRKENIKSKKVGEEHVVEAEFVFGGFIRWNVCFTSGVQALAKKESQERKPICSVLGFSCHKD
jgi:hypothetical protein